MMKICDSQFRDYGVLQSSSDFAFFNCLALQQCNPGDDF